MSDEYQSRCDNCANSEVRVELTFHRSQRNYCGGITLIENQQWIDGA